MNKEFWHDKSLQEETTHFIESSPTRPSGDDIPIKIVWYPNYKFVTIMDKYSNLTGSIIVKSNTKNFNDF